ncbi:helix-turn-helix transcriptional regulator [Pseudoalteromonas sp. PS5]|uniref:helix-turn-helix transcriptional regulator n=1 Tax=Pseudoalteromonas sp. PS5 TaxID=1437473 RepID=UPI000FFF03E1|nr:helix-turn-helix transcriptional regulator [Pseudoalteromonas sp. PS5]RXF05601.1 XRE family transcriptional regulator [Pseudoalteromonas sp. PS5]
MDMKLDNAKIKQLRESKAWSQAHLAAVSGISLRTIQRIEKTGSASPESVKSLCATFGIQIKEIAIADNHQVERPSCHVKAGHEKQPNKVTTKVMNKKAMMASCVLAFAIAFLLTA